MKTEMVSPRAKERFCKDCNIPIKIYREPYFSDRIILFDKYFGTVKKWNIFLRNLQKYHCEQDYFEEYNRTKDAAIFSIKSTDAFQKFNAEDMNKYMVKHNDLPVGDIFKPSNHDRLFVSVDMKKANFSALHNYDPAIFNNISAWEEFMQQFTDNQHIISSKYIRQVILGNCNPKRQVTYEKYLMDSVLGYLTEDTMPLENVVFFSNDEIVFDVTESEISLNLVDLLQKICDNYVNIPLQIKYFKLHRIGNTEGYYEEVFNSSNKRIEFKCVDSYLMPIVIRRFNGEEPTESDLTFYHNGSLARYIEAPEF